MVDEGETETALPRKLAADRLEVRAGSEAEARRGLKLLAQSTILGGRKDAELGSVLPHPDKVIPLALDVQAIMTAEHCDLRLQGQLVDAMIVWMAAAVDVEFSAIVCREFVLRGEQVEADDNVMRVNASALRFPKFARRVPDNPDRLGGITQTLGKRGAFDIEMVVEPRIEREIGKWILTMGGRALFVDVSGKRQDSPVTQKQ